MTVAPLPSQDFGALLQQAVLNTAGDDILESLVQQAADRIACPMAAFSLNIDDVLLFGAHHGFPIELHVARAEQAVRFPCLEVVQQARNLKLTEAEIPTAAVDLLGIRAYLGVPVALGGHVTGALAVVDVQARAFDNADVQALLPFADAIGERLAEIAAVQDRAAILEAAATPAFGELRNLLMPLGLDVATARRAVDELIVDETPLTERGRAAFRALAESLDEIEGVLPRARAVVESLQRMMRASGLLPPLDDVLTQAATLAHHQVRLAGEVSWPEVPTGVRLLGPTSLVTASLATALVAWAEAERANGPGRQLTPGVQVEEDQVTIVLPLSPVAVKALAARPPAVAALQRHHRLVRWAMTEGAMELTFVRA